MPASWGGNDLYHYTVGLWAGAHYHSRIELEEMRALERMIRLHYDLEINMEGIDAIAHLLERVEHMQEEMRMLRRKLGVVEEK
jgi:hypothetical protein